MLESAKTAVDGLKSVLSLQTLKVRNELERRIADVETAFAEARDTIYSLQQERTTLSRRAEKYKREVARLKDWRADKENYETYVTPFGSQVYAPKAGVKTVEPPHYLCQPCFDHGKTGRLQPTGGTKRSARTHSHHHEYECPLCQGTYGFDIAPPKPRPNVVRARRAKGSPWSL